ESPTTAREPDFDDETQEPSTTFSEAPAAASAPKKVSFQEEEEQAPPPKPPRPMSPQAQAEATLIEAFPSLDAKVVKAVLVASGGKVEPAFNALLSMSDPSYEHDPPPPPQPPRPTQAQHQLESDEQYARQLAAHYQSAEGFGAYGSRSRGDPPLPQARKDSNLKPNELYDDKEHSFFDDDLPVIRENVRQGFLQTQKTVNKWITDFRKRIDGDEEDGHPGQSSDSYQRQDYGPSQSAQMYGIRKSQEGRRSGDRERYDADPRVLSDDFTQLELRDEEAPPPQPPRNRPLANPDLFKPTPVAPHTGPVDEVDALYRAPTPTNRQPSPGNGKPGKKWQPLTSLAPNPESEDNDPFSLGDSDEEEAKTKDLKAEDTERLKKAAAEKGESGTSTEGNTLSPAERSGSINKE
ncbi:hypothetical protein NA57DRAFT_29017, partial [Rhizodiscina lignyota]